MHLMKRLFILLLPLFVLFSSNTIAQVQDSSITIPNGSFENWSTGNGYSVSVLFFSLPVYSSYTYPTNWDYPTYPVNENITYSGMNVNVNTNLPLMKLSDESGSVPDGTHALKLQSFMLSDIINSTVYNLAQSSLDTMLTTTVFPTVLSTGIVDIDELLPFMDDLTTHLGSMSQLLSVFDNVDINTLINGGLDLNGAVPTRLTGAYKYTSATSGDNGGIMILGTKYNTTTHQREVVGAGYTIALTDTSVFTPFEITYAPLSDINPSYTYIEADSLVIFLFSSANTSPQQGSALYLDNLKLWAQQTGTPIDTCSAVFNLHVIEVDTMHATIGWNFEGDPTQFEAEYGTQGFVLGSGTTIGVSESFLHLSDLLPDTYYDIYVRCVCNSALAGEWSMITFHTDTLVPPVIPDDSTGIQQYSNDNLFIYPNPAHGQCTVQFGGQLPTLVRLYTLNGSLVWEATPNKDTMEVKMPSKGVFLLVCEKKEGTVLRKIVNW